jgi:hypothetical protein
MNNKVIKEISMLVNFNIHDSCGLLSQIEGSSIKAQSQVSEHDSTL